MLTESGKIKGKYTGWAAYANMGFDITERLNVELGVRYTEDKKDFGTLVVEPDSYLGPYFTYGFSTDEYITDTQKWDDTTFRGLVTYAPTENSMIFASYTQGFKSGGYGSFWIEDASGNVPAYETGITQDSGYLPGTFEPETADSYEIGFKANYLDITERYVGIISGYGNTLGTFASWAGPQLVAAVLHWPIDDKPVARIAAEKEAAA